MKINFQKKFEVVKTLKKLFNFRRIVFLLSIFVFALLFFNVFSYQIYAQDNWSVCCEISPADKVNISENVTFESVITDVPQKCEIPRRFRDLPPPPEGVEGAGLAECLYEITDPKGKVTLVSVPCYGPILKKYTFSLARGSTLKAWAVDRAHNIGEKFFYDCPKIEIEWMIDGVAVGNEPTFTTSFTTSGLRKTTVTATIGEEIKQCECEVEVLPFNVKCSASPNPAGINEDVTFTAEVTSQIPGAPLYPEKTYLWTGACEGTEAECINKFAIRDTKTATVAVTIKEETISASCEVEVLPFVVECSASPNPAGINHNVTFFAEVKPAPGTLLPIGPRTYVWSGACIGTDSNTCINNFATQGVYTAFIDVTIGGETVRNSCKVDVLPFDVECSASPNPANINRNVRFTATVRPVPGVPLPTGPRHYSWTGACIRDSSRTCDNRFNIRSIKTATVAVTIGGETVRGSCSVKIQIPHRNRDPIPRNLQCLLMDGCLALRYHFSWDFYDPDGDRQSAYQIEIINVGGCPGKDSEKIYEDATACVINYNLDYATTYTWRLRVWDDRGAVSNWVYAECITPAHRWPRPDFDWSVEILPEPLPEPLPAPLDPFEVSVEQEVQFINRSVCFGPGLDGGIIVPCLRWEWDFDSDGTIDSTEQHPVHIYDTVGTYNIRLNAIDAANNVCSKIREIIVGEEVIWWDVWREIVPIF